MTADLIERLIVKSGVMQMGEPIKWGSDTALMDEAAAELARLGHERDWWQRRAERAENAIGGDAERKAERNYHDGLQRERDALREENKRHREAAEYHVARAERLREALQRCCEELEQWHDAKHILAIARAALEAKP